MLLKAEPLEQRHLDEMAVTIQPLQSDFSEMLQRTPDFLSNMKISGPCHAFLDGARVLGCSGLISFPGTGRSVLWCAYTDNLSYQFAWMFKKGMKLLMNYDWRRLEAWIDPASEKSKRFAKLGGLTYESTMKSFHYDGTDREMWVRVR